MGITLSYIIPVFNEAPIVQQTLAQITDDLADLSDVIQDYEIIVVDDHSTDDTPLLVEAFARQHARVRLLRHEKTRGSGTAILTGVTQARMEWVSANFADLPFHTADIRTFAALFPACDVVVVCRKDRSANSWYRKLTSWGNCLLIRCIFRSPIRDFQFVQFYRRALLEKIPCISRGTLVAPELILKSCRLGARIREVTLPFHRRTGGTSKYGNPKHIVIALREMCTLRRQLWKERVAHS